MDAVTLSDRLGTGGETELGSFTSEELVAVGADSPLEGLLISERLAGMGPIPLNAALGSALRSLVARGLVEPEVVSGSPAASAGTTGDQVEAVPLRGDLALVVELRRSPEIVGLVSSPRPVGLGGLSLSTAPKIEIVIHGLSGHAPGLLVLEERRSLLGIHRFFLRTLERQAAALVDWLAAQTAGGRRARGDLPDPLQVSIDLYAPEPDRFADDAGYPHRRLGLSVGPEAGAGGALEVEAAVLPLQTSEPVGGQAGAVQLSGTALVAALAAALGDAWHGLVADSDPGPGAVAARH